MFIFVIIKPQWRSSILSKQEVSLPGCDVSIVSRASSVVIVGTIVDVFDREQNEVVKRQRAESGLARSEQSEAVDYVSWSRSPLSQPGQQEACARKRCREMQHFPCIANHNGVTRCPLKMAAIAGLRSDSEKSRNNIAG